MSRVPNSFPEDFNSDIRINNDPRVQRTNQSGFVTRAEQIFLEQSESVIQQVEREERRLRDNSGANLDASRGQKFTMTNESGAYKTYRAGDIVFYDNKSYVAQRPISGCAPTHDHPECANSWQVIVSNSIGHEETGF
jgi:hypothetical protein